MTGVNAIEGGAQRALLAGVVALLCGMLLGLEVYLLAFASSTWPGFWIGYTSWILCALSILSWYWAKTPRRRLIARAISIALIMELTSLEIVGELVGGMDGLVAIVYTPCLSSSRLFCLAPSKFHMTLCKPPEGISVPGGGYIQECVERQWETVHSLVFVVRFTGPPGNLVKLGAALPAAGKQSYFLPFKTAPYTATHIAGDFYLIDFDLEPPE